MLYTIRLDHMMEDALRLNVKWSLLELSKAINGDGKTTPNPLFRVLVILQSDVQGGGSQVRTTVAPTDQKLHTSFINFLQSPTSALGLDSLQWPPGLALRGLALPPLRPVPSVGYAKAISTVLPTGGILTHPADSGRCGQ